MISSKRKLFVGWVSASVTHAGVWVPTSTHPTSIFNLNEATYLKPEKNLKMRDLKKASHA
jgi:hypothetical protein